MSNVSDCDDIDPEIRSKHIDEIYTLMYIEFGWVALLCILSWLYFPAKPPTPPSASAEVKRKDFIPGAKSLAVSKQFWLPALCYSICVGFYNVWESQIDTIFQNTMGVNQETTGRIGAYANIAGAAGGIIFSR
ncbi:solute carrier family 49 member 4 homolog [Amphiura filiformis]|uniref:solute carrier family 49 member 4 homolog n=1 Tax=Amphiura filiformis TaxID=82378 RepID=UPI003B20B99C